MINFLKEYWFVILVLFLTLVTIVRIKKRGYFWKTRNGEEIKLKEFFRRWGKGIEGITPLQQTKTQMMGLWITISGIIAGIVVNALIRMENQWWWIEIILLGSLIISGIQMVGIYQKYRVQKSVQLTMESLLIDGGKRNEPKRKKNID